MENLPTPLSRVELYLAKACGMDVTVPEEPMSRLEQFLAIIAGDTSIPMPTPMSLTEQWLAYVLGVTPDPLLAVEGACLIGAQKVDVRYFAVAASMPGATLPEAPQNRAEMYWAHIAVNPPAPGILKYVTGKYFYLTDVVSGIEELQYVKGDTYQQTYSGKNLTPYPYHDSTNTNQGIKYTPNADGTITVDGTWADAGTTAVFFMFLDDGVWTLPAGTYYMPEQPTKITAVLYDGTTYHSFNFANGYTRTFSEPITVRRFYIQVNAISPIKSFNNDTFYPMLTTTANPTYEPYVGGVPAPNPDYPQTVNVVTGVQTVTVSDDEGNIQTFTIDLGTTELCKIGNYQDKIFNNDPNEDWYDPDLEDNAWYVHKEVGYIGIGNVTNLYSSAGDGYVGAFIGVGILKPNSRQNGFCNKLTPVYSPSGQTTECITFGAGSTSQNIYLILKNTRISENTLTGWNTYLGDNPFDVYFPLATPTDTKITDATLVGQLDAINSAVLPKPVANVIVSATGTNLAPYLTIAYYGSEE